MNSNTLLIEQIVEANAVATEQSKAEIARKVLSEIGALNQNPPRNWCKTVVDKTGINQAYVYMIRKNYLNSKKRLRAEARAKAKLASQVQAKDQTSLIANQTNVVGDVFRDLQIIKSMLQKYGKKQMNEMMDFVQS